MLDCCAYFEKTKHRGWQNYLNNDDEHPYEKTEDGRHKRSYVPRRFSHSEKRMDNKYSDHYPVTMDVKPVYRSYVEPLPETPYHLSHLKEAGEHFTQMLFKKFEEYNKEWS